MSNYNCIAVIGPTASGKTRLACELAYHLNGEIISADSRQVYRFLDIGTGKDLDEYRIKGQQITHHVIDGIHPSEQFYLHQFMEALQQSFDEIRARHHLPIICGGTGLYLDALRKDFSLTQVGENEALRRELNLLDKRQLLERLNSYPFPLTQQVDRNSVKRLIRGIEIAEHCRAHDVRPGEKKLPYKPYYIGLAPDLQIRQERIRQRLQQRLDSGLIEETKNLLAMGVTPERLEYLGLEYKFVLHHLQGKLSNEELVSGLQTAIFQFAKRQMTWFRKMEKEGVTIHWIAPGTSAEELLVNLKELF